MKKSLDMSILEEMLNPAMIRVLPEGVQPKVGDIILRPETETDRELARIAAENERIRIARAEAKSEKRFQRLEKLAKDKEVRRQAEIARAMNRAAKRKAKKEREALNAERKAEDIRRRKDNPGNGTAAVSAQAFLGVDLTNPMIVKAANDVVGFTSLIGAVEDKIEVVRKERLELRAKRAKAKIHIQELSIGLKNPKLSSKVRAAKAEYQLIDKTIDEKTAEISDLNKKRFQYLSDKADAKAIVCGTMVCGNPAERATVKMANTIAKKTFRVVKGKAAKMREAKKVQEKEKLDGFSIRTFSNLLNDYICAFEELNKWFPYSGKDEKKAQKNAEERKELANKARNLIKRIAADYEKPFVVKKNTGRVTRLSKSVASGLFGIDPKEMKVHEEWIVIEKAIQESFHPNWKLFSDEEDEGRAAIEKIQKALERRFQNQGVIVEDKNAKTLYTGFASSASHQKKERIVMSTETMNEVLKDVLWFGTSEEHVINEMKIDGAEIWKGRANMIRPYVATMTLKDGTPVTLPRILVVKDRAKMYVHKNAITIGKGQNGKVYTLNEACAPTLLGDGMAIALRELSLYGQFTGYGLKGCVVDGASSLEYFCKKHNIANWEDLMVEDVEGNMVRLGDYDIIFGEGCWKFDKYHESWSAFVQKVEELTGSYPGLNKVRILRQIDDAEGESKIRRLTRSLIQQWIILQTSQIETLTAKTIKSLRERQTFEGVYAILAELNLDEADRSEYAKLLSVAPWLILNDNIQRDLQEKWLKKRNEAMGNKLKTSGQYPYIVQDPVAMLEVWVLGMDPNSEGLGVLKKGEISLDRVPENEKVLAVRFPANFLTAKVLVNRVCLDAFGSCGNVAVLSIYDDILIMQDGDVDGDEMCIIYDPLAIALTEQMIKMFNPPIVIFAHGEGTNPNKTVPGSKKILNNKMADALWRAKHFDKVGEYANLARDIAYLMSIAYAEGDMEEVKKLLPMMAAASTGAILAIDQVKGNQIDENLVSWIESIEKYVDKKMDGKSPRTQAYLKGESLDDCLGWSKACTDMIGKFIEDACPRYQFDSEGYAWNREAAWKAIVGDRELVAIKAARAQSKVLTNLSQNYFQDKIRCANEEEVREYEVDSATLDAIRHGQDVGQKEFTLLFFHNAMALSAKLEGRTLEEKKAEYYPMVFECLCAQALVHEYFHKDGTKYTEDEIKDLVAIYLAVDALEMRMQKGKLCSNKVPEPNKGKYVRFCMNVAAPRLKKIIEKSGVTLYDFLAFMNDNGTPEAEDVYEATSESVMNREYLTNDEDYYSNMPDESYRPSDEELIAQYHAIFG